MSITNYSELQTAVANWLNRSDLTTYIPDFIALGEVRINRDISKMNLVGLEKRATADLTAGDAYLGSPTGILVIKSVKVSGSPNVVLKYMTPDALSETYNSTATAKPRAYTIVGDEIKFGPIPDSAYTVEITYTSKETALSDGNTSNWFTANAPDLLLYAALMEAEPFLKNDARTQTWAGMYGSSLDALDSMNRVLQFPSSGLEMRVL